MTPDFGHLSLMWRMKPPPFAQKYGDNLQPFLQYATLTYEQPLRKEFNMLIGAVADDREDPQEDYI